MPNRRIPAWIVLILGAVGLLIVAIPGFFILRSLTTTPLHPDSKRVPATALAAPSGKSAAAAEEARQIALAHLTEKSLPGLSVAVGVNGDIVWAEGFGYADLRNSVPVTPDHRFRIGTASTALTSAAAGLLIDNGRLNPDADIQTYVPEFPRKQWPVTLRAVMGHTAGIPSDGGDEGPLFTKHCQRPVEALPHFAQDDLLFKPGSRFRFTTYGWILVSAAIETSSEQPFLTYLRERVFEPLGMRSTVPDPGPSEPDDDHPLANLFRELFYDPRTARAPKSSPAAKPDPQRVTPYFPRLAADPKYGLHLMRPLDYSCYAGSSVFVSTPSDLVRFGMAIHNGKLLQPATVELLQTPQRLVSGEETGYGLGWSVRTVPLAGKPTRIVGHDGDSLGGAVASLLTIPEYGMAVAVTSNISYSGASELAERIAGVFAEQVTNSK